MNLNQWKNTRAVLNWFNGIEHKERFAFIAFDVVDGFVKHSQIQCSYHISNGCMCISNQCNTVNLHLAILSDECCTQFVYYELNSY